jgi:hypothetical protein
MNKKILFLFFSLILIVFAISFVSAYPSSYNRYNQNQFYTSFRVSSEYTGFVQNDYYNPSRKHFGRTKPRYYAPQRYGNRPKINPLPIEGYRPKQIKYRGSFSRENYYPQYKSLSYRNTYYSNHYRHPKSNYRY